MDIIHTVISINDGASPEVSGVYLVNLTAALIAGIVANYGEIKDYASPAAVWTKKLEDSTMSDSTFLVFLGLNMLIEKEEDLRNTLDENGENRVPNKYKSLRDDLMHGTAVQVGVAVLLLFGPFVLIPIVFSFREHFIAREWSYALLCVGSFVSRLMYACNQGQLFYYVRLNQVVHNIELKRLQQNIRSCTYDQVYMIVPRINHLYAEFMDVCNKSHLFFILMIFFCVLNLAQLAVAIYKLNVIGVEFYEVPGWVLFGPLLPALSVIILYLGFAKLNRNIEREVDNDLVNLRMKCHYVEDRSLHETFTQSETLTCLKEYDSRVCVLPGNAIADWATGFQMGSFLITSLAFVAPYIGAMQDQIIFGYLSISSEE